MNFCIIESNFVIHEKNADLMCLSYNSIIFLVVIVVYGRRCFIF